MKYIKKYEGFNEQVFWKVPSDGVLLKDALEKIGIDDVTIDKLIKIIPENLDSDDNYRPYDFVFIFCDPSFI